MFVKKYINPANLNVSFIIRQLTSREITWHMREHCYESLTDSCEQFTDGYMLLRVVYDTYGLLRVIYGKINSWTIVRRILTCQKKKPLLSRILNIFFELLRDVTSYFRIPASYYGCLRLTTSWRFVRTRKKNPCM